MPREIDYLTWEKPAVVTEWEWRNEFMPQIKDLFRLWVKWSILLGIPTLAAIYFVAPDMLLRVALVVVAQAAIYPAFFAFRCAPARSAALDTALRIRDCIGVPRIARGAIHGAI